MYFPIFGLNTEKYGLEKPPYVDTFHTDAKASTAHPKSPLNSEILGYDKQKRVYSFSSV